MVANCDVELPPPTDDVERGARNLDYYGMTVHRGLFAPGEVEALRERLLEQAGCERDRGVANFAYDVDGGVPGDSFLRPHVGRPLGEPGLQRVFFLVNKGRVFIDLAAHPVALAYARHALRAAPFCVSTQYGLLVRRGAPPQALHMAQQNLPFSEQLPLALMVMVALNDQGDGMGVTRVLPGTHRRGPTAAQLSGGGAAVALAAGDALILDSRLWHGRGAARQAQPRYSVATLYGLDWVRPADCYPAAVHDDVYPTLSEAERQLFGFDCSCGGRFGPRRAGDRRANVRNPMPFVPALYRGGSHAAIEDFPHALFH